MTLRLPEPDKRPYHARIDYKDIVRRLKAGERNGDLAREHGVSAAAISKGAHKAGWQGRPNGSHYVRTLARDKLVVAALLAGVLPKAVAAQFGMTVTGVRGCVERSGLTLVGIRHCLVGAKAPVVRTVFALAEDARAHQ